jgi:DNA-directed RNA polymerase specialized sigma24 family protein
MSKKTVIDQTAFDHMLLWLNPDREKAAQKYEAIRTRLIEIFASRRFPDAELLADTTIDRVITKVSKVAEGWVGDPVYYFLAVAKKIILEASKPPPRAFVPPEQEPDELEREDRCLERCMSSRLPEDDRKLILEYVNGDKRQRQEQARKLGISPNALRIRVCQIKKILRPCVEDCLKEEAT